MTKDFSLHQETVCVLEAWEMQATALTTPILRAAITCAVTIQIFIMEIAMQTPIREIEIYFQGKYRSKVNTYLLK